MGKTSANKAGKKNRAINNDYSYFVEIYNAVRDLVKPVKFDHIFKKFFLELKYSKPPFNDLIVIQNTLTGIAQQFDKISCLEFIEMTLATFHSTGAAGNFLKKSNSPYIDSAQLLLNLKRASAICCNDKAVKAYRANPKEFLNYFRKFEFHIIYNYCWPNYKINSKGESLNSSITI